METTRERILGQARGLLREGGKATVGQIALAAGVSRTSFYRAFDSRDALLEAVCQGVIKPRNAYWHKWETDHMVIWDNRRMLHAVSGCDPKLERRMQRTTIKGDYGLGYFEDGKKIGEVHRHVAA